MAHTAAARLLSTEDLVLEILYRVSTDAAALFLCAVTCKRWRALVADRSFVRRCWPENARARSALLGFFDRQPVDDVRTSPYRLFFVPLPAGSVLGAQRRILRTIFDGLPDDDSQFAEPLAARRGLLLLRLVSLIDFFESVHMAVCDPLARTCHLLPPLQCKVSFVNCTVLTGAECGGQHHHQRSSSYFKVLAMVFFNNPKNKDEHDCNLYVFSSDESRWSAPTKLFNEIYRLGKRGRQFHQITNTGVVCCGPMAHWLLLYYFDNSIPQYCTLDVVSAQDTCHASLTELPIPANQLTSRPTLCVPANGSLSLFSIDDDAAHVWRLHVWQRGNNGDCQVWLHIREVELNIPRQPSDLYDVRIVPLEKSDMLIVIDESRSLLKIDLQTGEVEEQQLQNALSILAMPINIEWPTLFGSRLG